MSSNCFIQPVPCGDGGGSYIERERFSTYDLSGFEE